MIQCQDCLDTITHDRVHLAVHERMSVGYYTCPKCGRKLVGPELNKKLRSATLDAIRGRATDPNYDDSAREAWVESQLGGEVIELTGDSASAFDELVRKAEASWDTDRGSEK